MRITLPTPPARLYGIVGHPLGHSMSPALHNWAFKDLGIAGEYRAFPVEPSQLAAFMTMVRSLPIAGLSVTIPYKLAVTDYLDEVSPRAQDVGAVNTLYWDGERLLGENTDVLGFLAPLRLLARVPGSALVLGAGGAARAALAGLRELGVPRLLVANRSPERARRLAPDFGATAVPWEARAESGAELVVNTTPLGMKGERQDQNPWPEHAPLSPEQIAYDMVYNPQTTRFLAHAQGCGCRVIDGLEMFIGQGVEQFRLWTGTTFDVQAARRIVAALLAA